MNTDFNTRENYRKRVIVALDTENEREALRFTDILGDDALFYKLGMSLIFRPGLRELVKELQARGKSVFLDYKLHDIGNTVRNGVLSLLDMQPDMLTVHSHDGSMRAAVDAVRGTNTKIMAVTLLTDIAAAVYTQSEIHARAVRASELGCHGIIASATDNVRIPGLLLVSPGIRMPGNTVHDQKRTASPAEAMRNGADYIVVGRPILKSGNPLLSLKMILDDMTAWNNCSRNI